VPVRRRKNFRPFNISKQENKKQRNNITQIKNTGGDLSKTNETHVRNYLQIFVNFVKSEKLYDLQ